MKKSDKEKPNIEKSNLKKYDARVKKTIYRFKKETVDAHMKKKNINEKFESKKYFSRKYISNKYNWKVKSDTWREYEHMRWNVYTRTLGYVLAPRDILDKDGNLDKKIRAIAKVHNDLVEYIELPEAVKKQDALKLTPNIVRILKMNKTDSLVEGKN